MTIIIQVLYYNHRLLALFFLNCHAQVPWKCYRYKLCVKLWGRHKHDEEGVVLSRWGTLQKHWWNPWRSSGKSNWARQGYCMTLFQTLFCMQNYNKPSHHFISVKQTLLFEFCLQLSQTSLPSAGQIMCFLALPQLISLCFLLDGKEEVWEGNREVLQLLGEAFEHVSKEEGAPAPRGTATSPIHTNREMEKSRKRKKRGNKLSL